MQVEIILLLQDVLASKINLFQLVWARTHSVGCGVARCAELEGADDANENALFLVCNYGPG